MRNFPSWNFFEYFFENLHSGFLRPIAIFKIRLANAIDQVGVTGIQLAESIGIVPFANQCEQGIVGKRSISIRHDVQRYVLCLANLLNPCQGISVFCPQIVTMQQIARCSVRIAPMRVLPDHKSEQYSQLLMGDGVFLEQSDGVWVMVKSLWNGDTGWVLRGQLSLVEGALPPIIGLNALQKQTISGLFINELTQDGVQLDEEWEERYHRATSAMSIQPMPLEVKRGLGGKGLSLSEQVDQCMNVFLEAPYAWGGMSCWGMDCSGLVQLLYRYRGIPIPHSASKQASMGRILDFIQEARSGDLAFFNDADGQVVHVGIMLSPERILHASSRSGRVQVDTIDWQGIVNASGERTHTLRIITRLEE